MGKYIQKRSPKSVGDVAPIDIGVLTRAKTLALRKSGLAQAAYLQLRSRQLEKPPTAAKKRRQGTTDRKRRIEKYSPDAEMNSTLGKIGGDGVNGGIDNYAPEDDSVGENLAEFGSGDRESTPVSLIRDPNIMKTPGSCTRPTRSVQAQRQAHIPILNPVPTDHIVDAFFARAEVQQQQEFIEKYNFDPVKEVPLPGPYEWVKVDPKA